MLGSLCPRQYHFFCLTSLTEKESFAKKSFLSFLASSSLARFPAHLKLSESASCLPLLSQLLLEMLFLRNGKLGRMVNKTHMEPTCRLKTYLGRLAFNGMICRPLYNLGCDFRLFYVIHVYQLAIYMYIVCIALQNRGQGVKGWKWNDDILSELPFRINIAISYFFFQPSVS